MSKVEIITVIIRIAVLVAVGIIIPALRKWIVTKTDNENLNEVKQWAYSVVWAAEQLYNKVEKNDPDGEKRRHYAYHAVNRFAQKLGLALTTSEIEAIIECAVHELNGCRMPATNEIAAPEKEDENES